MNRSWLLFPEQLSMGEPSLSGSGEDPNCGETQILSEGLFCSLNIMFTLGPFWPFEVRSIFKNSQCTMYILGSMFSLQPNKLRHILKFVSWYIIQHIFVPTCSVGRKTWILRKPWFSNSKFAISVLFWLILSVPKIMLLVPENKKRDKFQSFHPIRR